ncbi:MAG: FAD:protein FMN transferase [Crocinitomicaceae bacterium]
MRNYSVIISLLFIVACSQKITSKKQTTFSGYTQGTTYSIVIVDDVVKIHQHEIDQLLADFDTVLSTYIDSSFISKFNNSTNGIRFSDKHAFFKNCYLASQSIYKETNGLFDPTVFPLVEAWGFFKKEARIPSTEQIDSILQYTGFDSNQLHTYHFDNDSVYLTKKDPRFKLDFNGIAQGYSVDVVAEFIEKKGYHNYYVEIGGEIRVSGKNSENKNWTIGIDTPKSKNNHQALTTISVSNCGIATSGNYRNFFEQNGKKYGHILNPKTGYPVQSDIASATVIAPNATLADAYATYFILLGKEKTIQLFDNIKSIQFILVYSKDNSLQIYHSKRL